MSKTNAQKKSISIQAIAEQHDMSPTTVYRMIYEGVLPSFKFGKSRRVLVDDLEKYISDQIEKTAIGC